MVDPHMSTNSHESSAAHLVIGTLGVQLISFSGPHILSIVPDCLGSFGGEKSTSSAP